MPPTAPPTDPAALQAGVESITEVLLKVASGNFAARAPRSLQGDLLDVLAFLVNATAEEVERLVEQLRAEREELQRTRDQLVLAEKLGALGRLAGGVAHEMNQPLTVIRVVSELLLTASPEQLVARRTDLALICDAAERMGSVVDRVRTFARSDAIQLHRVPAAEPLDRALLLLAQGLKDSDIAVERRLAADLPPIMADTNRLQQVFINLLANARDALEEIEAPRLLRASAAAEGDFVVYVVEDNGPGIPAAAVGRVFEPFFTTKEHGKGTGLGLSVSHGIVQDHHGRIECQQRAEGGTRFVVRIPVARA